MTHNLPLPVPLFRNLFIIMDPGRDQDDEGVLVGINRFIRLQILSVLGVVANLAPAMQRARLAKGTLSQLGQNTIAVGQGSSCKQEDDDGLKYQFNVGYLADESDIQDGKELILRTLNEAKPKGIVLMLISGLTDAAAVLREHPELFTSKVRRVVIMGGVLSKDDLPALDEAGRFLPDLTAQNHSFDTESSAFLYRQLQDLQIPMTVLSRHAAIAGKVPRAIYDDMAATGHPVGERLLAAQKLAIQELWIRACLPANSADRHGLPERCDKLWFCNTFCAGQGTDRYSTDSIWDIVQTFSLYDPCTLIAAIPNLREHFFAPQVVEVQGIEHLVVGVSAAQHNVRNGSELAAFLKTTLVESLLESNGVNDAIGTAQEKAA